MGFYLNNNGAFSRYQSEASKPYFVDKSKFLAEMIPLVEQRGNDVCVTRPRRFGKTLAATMIGAYFGKGADSSSVFDKLAIADDPRYLEHMNQHNLIYLDFSKELGVTDNYVDYIANITRDLRKDLKKAYPNLEHDEDSNVIAELGQVCRETGERFIFVFDEWDCIFHKPTFKVTEDDHRNFIGFLAALTKDQDYVELTYMTGILPIAKYSSGSSLNHFREYDMATDTKFTEYFGFTEEEVDELYERYLKINAKMQPEKRRVTREGLREWYDGYHMDDGRSMYNPRSVVCALDDNKLRSYWTNTGPYNEIARFITLDVEGVKKDVALLIDEESLEMDFYNAVSTQMQFASKEEIFSAMVIYGFLNYEDGTVRVPNRELRDEFADTIRRSADLGYIYKLARLSDEMLKATLFGDTETMAEMLERAHNTESPIFSYSNEAELSALVNLLYLSARNRYRVVREQKAGKGFADFIFYPMKQGDDGIILELKVDDTPENAIAQIREKQYALGFDTGEHVGGLGGCPPCTGNILLVGIGYDKKTKEHRCVVERNPLR
ncbi:MAG: ATP-binding protein [Clostridiales bacterium]|nr:ATP-binding protein [Clostridiales bacterium]